MIKTILGLFGVDSVNGPFTSNLKFTGGGTSSSDVNTLDSYMEGTFTPALTFNGVQTGITYTSRGGTYTRVGNMMFYSLTMLLSSKGSATGNVQVTGLPTNVSASASFPTSISLDNVTPGVGDGFISAISNTNTVTINIYKMVSGVQARLTDVDFTNTSIIRITGIYRV